MSKYRLRSVHGIAVDPYGWKTPTYSVPWWGPAVVAGSASSVSGTGAMSNKKERQRDSGPTRGNEIPQRPAGSAGTEVQAAPQPVTTPATPATTIPSGSTIVPANNTTPAPQTPPAQISTGGERRRTSGSTRGDEK
ncbi:MAG: hypothetical protein NTV54_11710 [Ignavibacteriales bacterium]|nr:hypothetical protein [Ignavibacteriales bacterium]